MTSIINTIAIGGFWLLLVAAMFAVAVAVIATDQALSIAGACLMVAAMFISSFHKLGV